MKLKLVLGAITTALLLSTSASLAHQHDVTISEQSDNICIQTNGLPNHDTGNFPNSGNPHTIYEQDNTYCVPANPVKNASARDQRGSVGIALNGVIIRPGTADYYDANSPRGHSRDRSSGWNLEGMGAAETLGMDHNNAHVDNRGLYHYHGVPTGLLSTVSGTQIGYAADGFEIHYVGSDVSSGWQLKPGTRPTEPFGAYDGTYEEDWMYVGGEGTLDKCNGGMLNGEFVYFATDTFPFYPRCMWGNASDDFSGPGGGQGGRFERTGDERGFGPSRGHRPPHHRRPPRRDY